MREKIGILEGIWGESDGEDQALKQRNAFEDDEDDDNDEDGHHSQGRTIDAVIGEERQTRTAERPVGGAANDYPGKSGRNGSLSGGHNDPFEDGENEQRDREAAAAAAEAGAGAGGGNKTSHDARHGRSASTGASTSAAGENPQDRAIISGADRQGFARKVAGGARVSGESGEDKDAGVDAWLISYNRRLKSELERLRGRARLAEERYTKCEHVAGTRVQEFIADLIVAQGTNINITLRGDCTFPTRAYYLYCRWSVLQIMWAFRNTFSVSTHETSCTFFNTARLHLRSSAINGQDECSPVLL